MYHSPMSLPVVIFAIVAFVCYLGKNRRKNKSKSLPRDGVTDDGPDSLSATERENIIAMENVVAQYDGYSAEVFDSL